jgi:ribosomal protein S18 acetylase RimI-like enzyme
MTPGIAHTFDPCLLSRVEDAGLNASAPPQQRWMDGWLVRFSPGKAKRARCINAVAPGRMPVAHKLALCEPVYAQAQLPLIVRITPFSEPPGLDATLQAMGMQRFDDTRVMVLEDVSCVASPDLPAGLTIQQVGLEVFAQRVGVLRGSPLSQRLAHGQRLAQSPVPFHAYELRLDGEIVACGQFALEADLVGLYDVFTAEPARGRGHARRLCAHLLAEAHQRGARHAYLQVEGNNHPARAIYHGLGFADAYAYHYRSRDPAVG